jgi:VanZ family protein
VLAYLGLIFFLSAQPHLQPPVQFSNSDKTYHLGEYLVLGALMARALRASRAQWSVLMVAAVSVALCSLWAASDEYHQSFVPGRDSSAFDWCADTMGALLAQCLRAGFIGDAVIPAVKPKD